MGIVKFISGKIQVKLLLGCLKQGRDKKIADQIISG
jgi:hypothetical protein